MKKSLFAIAALTLITACAAPVSDEQSDTGSGTAAAVTTVTEKTASETVTEKTASETVTEKITASMPDLSPLDKFVHEVAYDPSELEYDLNIIREYFYGTWENEDIGEYVIDDNARWFIKINSGKIGSTVFMQESTDGGSRIRWIDINNPGTMYETLGGIYENVLYVESVDDDYTDVYTRTDAPLEQPKDGYLCQLRCMEMAREYGFNYKMFEFVEYGDYYTPNHGGRDYPIYLISEAPEKIVFKTTVGEWTEDGSMNSIEVICTIYKDGGEWTMDVEPS